MRLLFVLLVSLNLLAELPDEINHLKYGEIYKKDKSVSDEAQSVYDADVDYRVELEKGLEQNINYLSQLNAEESQLKQRNAELRKVEPQMVQYIAELERYISQLENQIYNLGLDISKLNNQIQQKRSNQQGIVNQRNIEASNYSRVETQRDRKQSQVIDVAREISKLENLIARNHSRLQELNQELSNMRAVNQNDQGKINQLRSNLNSLNSQLKNKKSELANSNQELSKIESQIRSIEALIATEERKLPPLQESRKQTSLKKSQLERELVKLPQTPENENRIKQLNALIASLETQLTEINSKIANINNVIREENKRLVQLNAQAKPIENKISMIKTQISSLDSDISRKSNEKQQIENRMAQFTTRERTLLNNIQSASSEFSQYENSLRAETAKHRNLENQLRDLNSNLNIIAQRINQLDQQIGQIENQINQLAQNINHLDQQRAQASTDREQSIKSLNTQRSELNALRDEVSRNSNRIGDIKQEIPKVEKAIKDYRDYLVVARTNEQNSFQDWQSKLAVTNKSESEYRKRLNLYKKYLTEAKDNGHEQAKIGYKEGEDAGFIYLDKNVILLSDKYSSINAVLDSEYRAKIRAEILGYNKGYNDGYSDSGTISNSTSRAQADARRDAIFKAENELRAIFRKRYFADLLKENLSTPIEERANKSDSKLHEELKDYVVKNDESSTDLSSAEIVDSSSIKTRLDQRIEELLIEIKKQSDILRAIEKPQSSYEQLANVDVDANRSKKGCQNVYKNLDVYQKACVSQFVESYKSNYKDSHKEVYYQNFKNDFKEKFDLRFQAKRTEGYFKHKDSAYKISYADGKKEGQREIDELTYQNNYVQFYPQYLNEETNRVDLEEKQLAKTHLTKNAVVDIFKEGLALRSVGKYPFSPGSSILLDLLLRNLGHVASEKGDVSVEIIQTSSNLEVGEKLKILNSLKKRSNLRISEVFTLKIKEDAKPSDVIKVELKININDGSHYGQRVIKVIATRDITISPEAIINVTYEEMPRFRKMIIPFIIWAYPKKDIKVKVEPLYAGLKSPYKVKLEIDESIIKMKSEKDASTQVLSRGSIGSLDFVYKFTRKAKKKKLKAKVIVSYEDSVIYTKDIEITPIGK